MEALDRLKGFLPILNKWDENKFIKENITNTKMEEDNIDKTGFYVINSETEVAVRLRHEETGNDVTVRVYSVTPILDDTFKKELVELVKRLVNPLANY